MSPSLSEMQNENSIVCWPQTSTELIFFIGLGRQSRSKEGLAVSVLCYNQRMDKGQVYCDISITCNIIKTAITVINKLSV